MASGASAPAHHAQNFGGVQAARSFLHLRQVARLQLAPVLHHVLIGGKRSIDHALALGCPLRQ